MAQTFHVEGLAELAARFKRLDDEMQRKIGRAATAAGAKVIAQRIAELAPVAPAPYVFEDVTVEPRNLARNVVTKYLKPGRTDETSEHLVVLRGERKYGYASRVGALQEFGTVKQPAQPFFRPGAEQAAPAALEALTKRLRERLDKAAAEVARGA